MVEKGSKCMMRKVVDEQISLLRSADNPVQLGEILVSLMGHNAPTFRQWRRVLWWLFKKKFDNHATLYTIYKLADMKAKEEEGRIRSRQKQEEFQKRFQAFSNWFWEQHKRLIS